jgi:hypothetical protein
MDKSKTGCPNDTNGDGDCGRPLCPHCGKFREFPAPLPKGLSLDEEAFVCAFNIIAEAAHLNAINKGWWEDRHALMQVARDYSPKLGVFAEKAVAAMMTALEHSELSEGLEGIRKDLMDDKVPEFTMEEAEAADTIIRIMDRAVGRKLRVAEAIVAKMRMNRTRPALHGGKAF